MGMKCVSCECGGKHCLGSYPGCICECVQHTLPDDDVRNDVIALLTAEAHKDGALLEDLLVEMSDDRTLAVVIVLVKYISWMLNEAGIDPVEMIQKTALYWAGGEPSEDDDSLG